MNFFNIKSEDKQAFLKQFHDISLAIYKFNHYGFCPDDYSKCHDALCFADYEKSKRISSAFAFFLLVFLICAYLHIVPYHYLAKYGIFLFLILLVKLSIYLWKLKQTKYFFPSIHAVVFLILSFGIVESVYDPSVVATAILPFFIIASIICVGPFFEYLAFSTIALIGMIVSSALCKDPIIVHGDIVNCVSFYLVSLFINYFYQSARYKSFLSNYNLKIAHHQISVNATFDTLSGALNRGTFSNVTNAVFSRSHDILAVCLLDIDNFKYINDNFGHEIGDNVIEAIGEAICVSLDMPSIPVEYYTDALVNNNLDYFGRLGGDEFFVVIRKDVSKEKVIEFAEYLKQTVSSIDVHDNYNLTYSMGIVMVPDNINDFKTIYRKADLALYESKKNGKNQYQFYEL